MKIWELREKLLEYNPDANVEVVVANYPRPFEICFGGSDGCTKQKCENVSFMVDSASERRAVNVSQ